MALNYKQFNNKLNRELKLINKKQRKCDHDDVEDTYCLDCGKDLTEELASKAYDQYKDHIKYGD